MFTRADVKVAGREASLSLRGAKMHARLLAPADASFEIGSAEAPAGQSQQPDVRSLRVHLKTNFGQPQRIAVFFTPSQDGKLPELQPLDNWIVDAEVK